MYRLTIIPVNINANPSYLDDWLKSNYKETYINFSSANPCEEYPEGICYINFSIEPSEIEEITITNKYLSLTINDFLPEQREIYIYSVRKTDGNNYYNEIRSQWALEINEGELSLPHQNYRQHKISVLKSFLLEGDWADAQYEMDNTVVTNGVVSQEDIDNSFTQELYDGIKMSIDLYVILNYPI